MIGKQIKGTGFRGCLNYVLGKKDADLIGGTMCGQTPEELAAEFAIARPLRPNLKVAVFHATLSVASTQKLEDSVKNEQRWLAIAADYMKAMEFDNNQYAVVKHNDTDHDHIHIVASRICLDGSVVDDSWDYYKSQEVIRQLEQDYNLETIAPSWELDKRAPTTGEHRYLQSKGNKSVRVQLQDLIDEVTQDKPTMPELVEQLQQQSVEVQVRLTRTGLSKGISYKLDGVAFSGTHLGKAYTFSGLQKHRGVSYDQGRDNALIEALMQRQNLANARGEAQANELESLQSEVRANELESLQSEVRATAPVTPAIANELELQLSILPESNEIQWTRVRSHLAKEYSLPLKLLDLLHSHSWLYADSEAKAVFTKQTLYGETCEAFVLDEIGNFTTTHTLPSEATFWVTTTGEIERAMIACNPIETLSILLIERENNPNNFATVPPTIYIGIERASQLPRQFLQELDTVIIAIAEDSLLAQNVLALLPNAEIANPQSSWNDIWIQLIEQKQLIEREQLTYKQNSQHQKQRIQEIELD
ncbi:relaxase/mobilization nuclease domain-containing protein [Kamptonema formosum]|nr:relaxase/mobilization nuclease domain-containing protein [Kamptonema formosum]